MVIPVNVQVGDFVRFKLSAKAYQESMNAPDVVQVIRKGSGVFWWTDGKSTLPCSYSRVKRAEGPW